MAVTQNQRNVAEALVKRMEENLYPNCMRRKVFETEVNNLFYFIFRVLSKEIEAWDSEQYSIAFTSSYDSSKHVVILNLDNYSDSSYFWVSTIKGAKKLMKEVADIFNELPHYKAKFYPTGNNNRGTLRVYIDLNKE